MSASTSLVRLRGSRKERYCERYLAADRKRDDGHFFPGIQYPQRPHLCLHCPETFGRLFHDSCFPFWSQPGSPHSFIYKPIPTPCVYSNTPPISPKVNRCITTMSFHLRPVQDRSASPSTSTSTASERSPPPHRQTPGLLPPHPASSNRPRRPLSPSSLRGSPHSSLKRSCVLVSLSF